MVRMDSNSGRWGLTPLLVRVRREGRSEGRGAYISSYIFLRAGAGFVCADC